MIEVKHLTKRYGNTAVVDDLSFRVEQGQIYGFLGPNGAGKSTTMNMITGYIAATEGEILINGHNILTEPKQAKASLGYLPEIPPLYPEMTVHEYLTFVAELKGISGEQRAEEVAQAEKTLHIEDVSSRLIRNLSKGYRQRVGFAQALLGMPEILILDEPTVGLDPLQIIEIRQLIKDLGEKHTIILSSHILSEVSAICDHILIIQNGHLVADDTTENLLSRSESLEELFLELTSEEEKAAALESAIQDADAGDSSGNEEAEAGPDDTGAKDGTKLMDTGKSEDAGKTEDTDTDIMEEGTPSKILSSAKKVHTPDDLPEEHELAAEKTVGERIRQPEEKPVDRDGQQPDGGAVGETEPDAELQKPDDEIREGEEATDESNL